MRNRSEFFLDIFVVLSDMVNATYPQILFIVHMLIIFSLIVLLEGAQSIINLIIEPEWQFPLVFCLGYFVLESDSSASDSPSGNIITTTTAGY